MSEIPSITPIHSILKPVKIQRDDDSLSKRQQSKRNQDLDAQHASHEQHEQDAKPIEHDQDAQPIQHIDEIV